MLKSLYAEWLVMIRFQSTIEQASRYGIDHSGIVVDASMPTCVKTRVIAHNQQLVWTAKKLRPTGPRLTIN